MAVSVYFLTNLRSIGWSQMETFFYQDPWCSTFLISSPVGQSCECGFFVARAVFLPCPETYLSTPRLQAVGWISFMYLINQLLHRTGLLSHFQSFTSQSDWIRKSWCTVFKGYKSVSGLCVCVFFKPKQNRSNFFKDYFPDLKPKFFVCLKNE